MTSSHWLAVSAIFCILCGCTQSANQSALKPPEKSKGLFSFQYDAVTEVLIAKNDLVTGDHWTARIQRPSTTSSEWRILSVAGVHDDGHELLDRRADGAFILHLLDTFRTLTSVDVAQSGAPEVFGLNPPLFVIRWTAPEGTFEVHLGAPTGKENTTYALLPAREQIFAVQGAALTMLSYLRSFESLRYRQLSTWTSDDVDEIELRKGRRAVFYAQREGSQWLDRKHRPLSFDVNAIVEGLTHARIKSFIDDEAAAQKLLPQLTQKPLYEAIFRDRHHQTNRLVLAQARTGDASEVIALTSSRPKAVFTLFPEATRLFMIQSK